MDKYSRRFVIIEHTADIGVTVYGKTLEELFENSAYGMFSQMTDIEKVNPEDKVEVQVEGYDKESLLVNWLNELLYLPTTKRMLFSQFKIKNLNVVEDLGLPSKNKEQMSLTAEIRGEKINPKKHSLHLEIKAATYHNLKITKTKKGYQTTIIFDV